MREPLFHDGVKRALDQLLDQGVRRVIGAGLLALAAGEQIEGPARDIDLGVVVEEALIDRAQLLGLHVPPVDPLQPRLGAQPGKPEDRLVETGVGERAVAELAHAANREQAAEAGQIEPLFADRQ